MLTIWKYPISSSCSIEMPRGAEIKRVTLQNGQPMLWVEVEKDAGLSETKHFQVFGTGQEIPSPCEYIGSFTQEPFEWHVYEIFK